MGSKENGNENPRVADVLGDAPGESRSARNANLITVYPFFAGKDRTFGKERMV